MRKIIVSNIISLDGYYEGPDKNIMALPFDNGFDAYNAERLRAADMLLLGKATFELFKNYWPGIAADTKARPIEREISRINNAIEKIVISDSLTTADLGIWEKSATVIKRANSPGELKKLKNKEGKDILIFGSHTLWNGLLTAGLIDELHFMIGPALLGSGTPVYESDVSVRLQLIDSQVLNNSQLVLNRYSVAR